MGYKQVIALKAPAKPNILLYDIETTPINGWAWSTFKTNLFHIEQDSYALCYGFKWLGKKNVQWVGLNRDPDYDPPYAPPGTNHSDRWLIEKMWRLYDRADWVIAHNGDRFDQRKMNARFLLYDLPPPSDYQTIDTLKVSRKNFSHSSNKLDELGRAYLERRKEKHLGLDTWFGCMAGDPAAWRSMRRYNIGDVQLLEDWYLRIRPWISGPSAPNMSHWSNGVRVCTQCGSEELVAIGTVRRIHEYQQWRCTNCGKPNRARLRRQETRGNEPRTV